MSMGRRQLLLTIIFICVETIHGVRKSHASDFAAHASGIRKSHASALVTHGWQLHSANVTASARAVVLNKSEIIMQDCEGPHPASSVTIMLRLGCKRCTGKSVAFNNVPDTYTISDVATILEQSEGPCACECEGFLAKGFLGVPMLRKRYQDPWEPDYSLKTIFGKGQKMFLAGTSVTPKRTYLDKRCWTRTDDFMKSGKFGTVISVELLKAPGGSLLGALKQPIGDSKENEHELNVLKEIAGCHGIDCEPACQGVVHVVDDTPCLNPQYCKDDLPCPGEPGWLDDDAYGQYPWKDVAKLDRSAFVMKRLQGDLSEVGGAAELSEMCLQGMKDELSEGIQCIANSGWVHQDLKRDNVMYSDMNENCPTGIHIVDLGLAARLNFRQHDLKPRGAGYLSFHDVATHLPSGLFENRGGGCTHFKSMPADITAMVEGKYIPSTSIDLCSASYMFNHHFERKVAFNVDTNCGCMGPGREIDVTEEEACKYTGDKDDHCCAP